MNKQTQEYLEMIENLPKNGRGTYINHGKIFKKAQDGDMEALNYLFENNEYIIHEVIRENTRFINTGIDIQVYIDYLTDALIDCIKKYDVSKRVAFRSFARKSLYLHLSVFNTTHPKLTDYTIIPLSAYDKTSDEEEYPICRDKRNIVLDEIEVINHNQNVARDNAQSLWEKLRPFINDEEYNILYSHIVLNQSQGNLAQRYNTSRQMISYLFTRVSKRISNLVKMANETYRLIEIEGLTLQQTSDQLNIENLNHTAFYLQTYKYLYQNGEKPWGIIFNGYLAPVSTSLYRYNCYYDIYAEKNRQLDD